MRIRGSALLIAVGLILFNCGGNVTNPGAPPATLPLIDGFAKGADVSWITEMEASGKQFFNSGGTPKECMQLLKDLGFNSIRLRAWVNPANKYNNTKDVVIKAKRAQALQMRVMIDFHFSDSWADPGKQNKPAAWTSLSIPDLKTAVFNYTLHVMDTLKSVGVTPAWAQIGNETNDGMLWEDGRATKSFPNLSGLMLNAYNAVKQSSPNTLVIIHISNGYDNSLYRWMFDNLKVTGAKWDIIGMSLYPSYASGGLSNWMQTSALCQNNMYDMVQRYNTPVMIVEVGIPVDQATTARDILSDLIDKVNGVPNAKGLGVFYWEPECYNWQGYNLGAFDNSGKPTVALDAFSRQ